VSLFFRVLLDIRLILVQLGREHQTRNTDTDEKHPNDVSPNRVWRSGMCRYRKEVADHKWSYCSAHRLVISPVSKLRVELTAMLNASELAKARYSGLGIISKTKVSRSLSISVTQLKVESDSRS